MKPKSIFRSRTALLGLITAAAGAFSCISEETHQWIADHSGPLLIAIGAAGVILRKLTHGRVVLFPDPELPDFLKR